MKKNIYCNIFSVLVFAVCMVIGFKLTLLKPLWNDEIYTQFKTVEGHSYAALLKGEPIEGANSPAYYVIQKMITSAVGYHYPSFALTGQRVWDPYAQVLLRFSANVCMSLAITLIARYCFLYFSWQAGILAVITSVSSYMVLAYWAEARPYALWVLLSVLQLFTLLRVIQTGRGLFHLALIHFLMVLTVTVSIGQVLAAFVVLFLSNIRNLKFLIGGVVLPLGIFIFYYLVAQSHGVLSTYEVVHPFGLLNDVFGLDRLGAMAVFGFLLWLCTRKNPIAVNQQYLWKIWNYFIGIYIFAGLVLLYFKSHEKAPFQTLNSRYFIFLTPMEIIVTVFTIVYVYQFIKQRCSFWRWHYVMWIVFLYVVHAMLIWKNIYKIGLFAYG